MDIERLTKTQIVLLTLLVSFITSIATGIVTVSLIEQAPPALTRTINRVVERTVERVVAGAASSSEASTGEPTGEPIREVTVVVKENDLIVDSVEKNLKKVVKVSANTGSRENPEAGPSVGLGLIMTRNGIIATDSTLIGESGEYLVTTSDNAVYRTEIFQRSGPVVFLRVISSVSEPPVFSPISPADESTLSLAETVIALSSDGTDAVAVGIISRLPREGGGAGSPLSVVETDIRSSVSHGSPLVSLFGEVIGMQTSNLGGSSFTPIRQILALIPSS